MDGDKAHRSSRSAVTLVGTPSYIPSTYHCCNVSSNISRARKAAISIAAVNWPMAVCTYSRWILGITSAEIRASKASSSDISAPPAKAGIASPPQRKAAWINFRSKPMSEPLSFPSRVAVAARKRHTTYLRLSKKTSPPACCRTLLTQADISPHQQQTIHHC